MCPVTELLENQVIVVMCNVRIAVVSLNASHNCCIQSSDLHVA